MNTRVCAVSFHHAETPGGSLKRPLKPPLLIITFDIVAYTFSKKLHKEKTLLEGVTI